MAKRMIIMLLAVVSFVGALGFVKYQKIQTSIKQASSFAPPPEAVTTIMAREETWQGSLGAIGTVTAVNGVVISADLPGVVQKITFKSGDRVAPGDLLVQLDTRQEEAQLAAAEAKLTLTRLNLERSRGLRTQGISAQADYDTAEAEQKQAEGNVAEIRATIERKTVRAPFAGILGIRQVNLGQYLKSGDPVVPLQSLDPIYVNFGMPQQELGRMQVGGAVSVTAEGIPNDGFPGRITAIDTVVDESTRNVRVQATFSNPRGLLRAGMFVTVRAHLDSQERGVILPASAISYAPYGDSVYIVEEMKGPTGASYKGVRQQVVKLGSARGDQIAILSGISPGAEVVTSGAFKLRNGAAVLVNNETQPGNSPSPRPEDN